MTPITVAVPDDKAAFFKELLETLHFEEINFSDNQNDIPVQHQQHVLNRIETAKEEDFISWENAKKKLKEENGF